MIIILTVITQIGGVVLLISLILVRYLKKQLKYKLLLVFLTTYLLATFLIVPLLAPLFGREKVMHSDRVKPTNYMTVLLNRNYVRPKLNRLLLSVAKELENTPIQLNYLDANFPFINKFPLLPHLSHNDGKKIDISLVYEDRNGQISKKQCSRSGYGMFVAPKKGEHNQIKTCLNKGYFQYDYPKYLTLGKINRNLVFSKKGTKTLIKSILKQQELGKLFIEPHLKARMHLINAKIRYHGCRAVRHDDHIHIQLK